MSDRRSLEVGGEDTHAGPVEPYMDPGLPDHPHRLTDIDPKAAKRAERQVAGLFVLSALATLGFVVAYVALPLDGSLRRLQASNLLMGVALGVALLAIGVAAIHWAKKLMPDVEVVADRHPLASSEESRADALSQFEVGTEESGFGRRSLIRRAMIGSLALLPLPAVVLLRDLGPLPGNDLAVTNWEKGIRLVTDPTLQPIKISDLEIGQLVNVMPANFEEIPEEDGVARQVARARDAVIVVRMPPDEVEAPAGRENWGVDGVLAYSKICTHVGCPISLYERTTHHLLCPCHQSTFVLNQGGKIIFGPAARPLPQLPIEVDPDGYLVAKLDNGFQEPIGPSYFERGER
jgi:ubiquinol-cytochrome c reductase iron-sulfur subunit